MLEVLLVISITVIITTVVIGSSTAGRASFEFQVKYDELQQFLRQPITWAASTRTFPDIKDFDNDNDLAEKITPSGYGVSYDSTAKKIFIYRKTSPTIEFDLTYDSNKDIIVDEFFLDQYELKINRDQASASDFLLFYALPQSKLSSDTAWRNLELTLGSEMGDKSLLINRVSGFPTKIDQ